MKQLSGKGTRCQAQWPALILRAHPHGKRRKLTPKSFPLTSTQDNMTHDNHAHAHTMYARKINASKRILKVLKSELITGCQGKKTCRNVAV